MATKRRTSAKQGGAPSKQGGGTFVGIVLGLIVGLAIAVIVALYITRSPYLAQNARDLYYASGFEREEQDATFLSYREFLESMSR